MLDENIRGTNAVIVETFDNNCHVLSLVSINGQYYLQHDQDSKLITKLIIKPDFWAFFKHGGYTNGVDMLKPVFNSCKKILAMNYYIDPNIFEILIDSDLISYSKAMADLYDLPVSYSRDVKYHHNDYKRTKNKELVLNKMRQGIFN